MRPISRGSPDAQLTYFRGLSSVSQCGCVVWYFAASRSAIRRKSSIVLVGHDSAGGQVGLRPVEVVAVRDTVIQSAHVLQLLGVCRPHGQADDGRMVTVADVPAGGLGPVA